MVIPETVRGGWNGSRAVTFDQSNGFGGFRIVGVNAAEGRNDSDVLTATA